MELKNKNMRNQEKSSNNLSKGELKSKLSFLVLHHNPELIVQDSDWNDVYYYYRGYSECFKAIVTYPFADNTAQDWIIEECFQMLLSKIEK